MDQQCFGSPSFLSSCHEFGTFVSPLSLFQREEDIFSKAFTLPSNGPCTGAWNTVSAERFTPARSDGFSTPDFGQYDYGGVDASSPRSVRLDDGSNLQFSVEQQLAKPVVKAPPTRSIDDLRQVYGRTSCAQDPNFGFQVPGTDIVNLTSVQRVVHNAPYFSPGPI